LITAYKDELQKTNMITESTRLEDPKWREWGPYLSERQWGTVREDYSPDGSAWDYFSHDHARSRAYRWGEDGIAGLSDSNQRLCLGLSLWNGRDPIIKERLFGLTNREGNHGEDVKEVYYYLDATPSHSYLKMLYKYPQREFPYAWLVEENRRRNRGEAEFELVDTGTFQEDRYWDVFVEYAKAGPEDILMKVTAYNRGPEAASLHLMPQIWFRNTWAWTPGQRKPVLQRTGAETLGVCHPELGIWEVTVDPDSEMLFTENETNTAKLFGVNGKPGPFKDGFHDYLIHGLSGAVNANGRGTKAGLLYVREVPPGQKTEIRIRLSPAGPHDGLHDFDLIFQERIREANQFYDALQSRQENQDKRLVQRQALAGLIWSKQYFHYDVPKWLNGDPGHPAPHPARKFGRNSEWDHLNNADIISIPDKWEYPWYAAWDLAFHTVAFSLVDPQFAKDQLILMTREWYMHPNGQLPAYEWAFGDVNPPVHGWAAWRVFQIDRKQRRKRNLKDPGDLDFLERIFHKLLLNFTWWVNRKDVSGRNVFQGGFLGLDNIGVFDRSAPLPTGGYINQSDGTSWMAMYSLNLMRIALELARHNHVYEDVATKFFEHFLHIAKAIGSKGENHAGLWDEEDGFFYDTLNLPVGQMIPLKVRSMVGLIPLFAVEVLDPDLLAEVPEFTGRLEWFLNYRPDLAQLVSRWEEPGKGERRLLSLLRGSRMKKLLRRMLDPSEFLSNYGVRGVSRFHLDHPYEFRWNGSTMSVNYQPGESDSALFGGNSNWRGPIWFPVNYLLVESLRKFHHYYGNDFRIEIPTGSGNFGSIGDAACEVSRRLCSIFLRNAEERRPVLGNNSLLQDNKHFRDHVPFYEYFHGETGRGVGASHQTGWTALVAKLLQIREVD
jgi:hypothetical protein